MSETSAPPGRGLTRARVAAARRARALGAAGLVTVALAFHVETGQPYGSEQGPQGGDEIDARSARDAPADADAPDADASADTDTPADERSAAAPAPPPVQQAKPEQTETPVDGEIVSRIVGLERLRSGNWRIRLENGQVWQQRHGERLPLRAGYDVRIYESRFGGYRLEAAQTRGFIDVERLQ